MGARNEYGPGTFCWVSLSSTEPETAKRFYAGLFDWDYDDGPGAGGGFSMARCHGANVAGICRNSVPASHWNSYVGVADVDAVCVRAEELGGLVDEEPFDVSDAGRAAVLVDPTGATVAMWQPRRHFGAGWVNDVGCLTFNELRTSDAVQASDFYAALFGWTFDQFEADEGPGFWVIGNGTAASGLNGIMRELPGDASGSGPAPMWIPYFAVESVDSATSDAEASGGRIRSGVSPAGEGMIAAVTDPTGAVFGLFEGDVDD